MQIISFIQAHWQILLALLLILAIAAVAYINWQFSAFDVHGPTDVTGNGITVGLAKAFDNRSLALRIERLSNSLAQMKVVDQKFTENVGKTQGSTVSTQTLTLDLKRTVTPTPAAAAATANQDKSQAAASAGDGTKQNNPADASKQENKGEVALAASDILNEQLNLASQIMNLQTLYERSLTDRLLEGHARLQTVLGFQVSITPPAGFENCVAVVEVSVRLKEPLPVISYPDTTVPPNAEEKEEPQNEAQVNENEAQVNAAADEQQPKLNINKPDPKTAEEQSTPTEPVQPISPPSSKQSESFVGSGVLVCC